MPPTREKVQVRSFVRHQVMWIRRLQTLVGHEHGLLQHQQSFPEMIVNQACPRRAQLRPLILRVHQSRLGQECNPNRRIK